MNGQERSDASWNASIATPDRRPIYDWAHDHVNLPAALTVQGKFHVHRSRHLIGPFDALADDHVREVTVMVPVRGGKTLIADVWVPWIICNDPGPIMFNFQKDDKADEHCEQRLWPILENCEPVARLFPSDRHKLRTSEIVFPHLTLIVQGPVLTNLQSRGVRYLINDEVWQYAPGILREACGRVGDFVKTHTSKILNLSQAGDEGDDLDVVWQKSSRNEWTVICQSCSHRMIPRWSGHRDDGSKWGMRWDTLKKPDGSWDIPKIVPTIRFECEKCGHPHLDTTRTKLEWNRTGSFLKTNEEAMRKSEGFHWNAIIDYPWSDLVEENLEALNSLKAGNIYPIIQFFQKRMAEPKGERSLLEGSLNFNRSAYEVSSEWPGETHRCMTVDKQEQWYWISARAWNKVSGESRRLLFKKVFSEQEIEVEREKLKIGPKQTLIDCGYQAKGPHGVYAACRRYGWVSVKGDKARQFPRLVGRGAAKSRVFSSFADLEYADPEDGASTSRGRVPFIRFSAEVMSDRLRNLIDQGKWIEPANSEDAEMEKEYQRQMADEFKTKETDKYGRDKWAYVSRTGNNHAFDLGKMQVLFATLAEIVQDQ